MQVRFVGCGDALGSGGRSNTCFHITGARVNVLIDCGASSLPALKRLGVARENIDLIFITHFHGDHFAGLPFLLLDAQFTRRARPLVIAGPQGIETRMMQVMEALFENSSKQNNASISPSSRSTLGKREPSARSMSLRFRWCMASPAARFWPTGSRPRAASSAIAPTPN